MIVFDDIERTGIPMKQLLGFINYFIEHCACHVVVIGDEGKISGEAKKVFDGFKEKTIGRTFEVKPDVDDAIETFVSESDTHPFLAERKALISSIFRCVQYDNLRILRRSIQDFSAILRDVEREDPEVIRENPNIFQDLLKSFIVLYFEYSNPANRELLQTWHRSYMLANPSYVTTGEEDNAARKLVQKYGQLSMNDSYDLFNIQTVWNVVEYLDKATDIAPWIKQEIQLTKGEPECFKNLRNYETLDNDEFDKTYREVMELIRVDNMSIRDLAFCIKCLGEIDKNGVKSLEADFVGIVQDALQKRLDKVTTMEELYSLKREFMSGYANSMSGVGKCKTDDLSNQFCQDCEAKASQLPNEMKIALESLTDASVKNLESIDGKTAPNGQSSYQLTAIFKQVDEKKLFACLQSMSNKGRRSFALFLRSHYMIDIMCVNDGDRKKRYAEDLLVLEALKASIDNIIREKVSVEKLSYETLSSALEKSIKRCTV